MSQLSLDFASVAPLHDDGWPHKEGKWVMISRCSKPGYAPGEWRHLTFKSAINRALTLLKESPAFYASIEVVYRA